MEHTVRIRKNDSTVELRAESGTRLLEFLQKNSVRVSSPCGGNGTCGKCRVRVDGIKSQPSEKEKSLLGNDALENGIRLACYNKIQGNLDIYADERVEKAVIVTEGIKRDIRLGPVIRKEYAELPVPELNDQDPDLERILKKAGGNIGQISMKMLAMLPDVLRSSDFKVTFVYNDDSIIAVEAGNTVAVLYGIAVDIGTTTIAAYLYDLNTGRHIDTFSAMNPQRKFGADVLSRIDYTINSETGLKSMHNEIINCVNGIIRDFTTRNNIGSRDIYAVTFAGNTTMMHFLMKLNARNIAVAPFIPVTTNLHNINAAEIGININNDGRAIVIPGVTGYIGADTVAAALSSGMYEDEKTSLLIDIGTNGEIVLGNKEWLFSCSTAAGPAFEGANIRNGMGGVTGAISVVKLVPELKITTIGNARPIGICGSGIVDSIAGMLAAGLIDETGRLADEDEAEKLEESLRNRLVDEDGKRAFLLVSAAESGNDSDIAITQKDVRELQNAKAAIAAGIRTLVKYAGISFDKIDNVYLAGGFGSFMDIESAIGIGLLPSELRGRIKSIGNAAGSGAVEALLSNEMLKMTERIKARIRHVELSGSPEFTEEYIECMMFE
ncbi:MAG: DUF4445 domain-containing protein [Ruminiclostridium sp.]|nr:DUF4445 domain-containing protein [Ruminiclostridium sp.]